MSSKALKDVLIKLDKAEDLAHEIVSLRGSGSCIITTSIKSWAHTKLNPKIARILSNEGPASPNTALEKLLAPSEGFSRKTSNVASSVKGLAVLAS